MADAQSVSFCPAVALSFTEEYMNPPLTHSIAAPGGWWLRPWRKGGPTARDQCRGPPTISPAVTNSFNSSIVSFVEAPLTVTVDQLPVIALLFLNKKSSSD